MLKKINRSFFLLVLIWLVFLIRLVSGKYEEGIVLISFWLILVTIPMSTPLWLKVELSTSWQRLLFGYFLLLFISILLIQPLIWELNNIGYLRFFFTTAFIFLPVEIFFLYGLWKTKRSDPEPNNWNRDLKKLESIQLKYPSGEQVLPMQEREIVRQIRELIAEDRIGEAIDLFKIQLPAGEKQDDLLLLQQQRSFYLKQQSLGLITEDSFRVMMAHQTTALLAMLNDGLKD